ncbi:hypothetical protein ONE63_010388 [Megalurothrips usitatus]|uniref:Uncharacterized protein n=1 Tax=Megalurothrips usitatus TaxID=439358 RepID=A0AAV7XGX1_9NEOP|nr:hypothetical protein ONE63_010388 [Megalurothrips usitatus]
MAGEKASRKRGGAAAHRDMAYDEKLRLLDDELTSFHQSCQQAGFTAEEMEAICAPLVDAVRAARMRSAAKTAACVLLAVGLAAVLASTVPVSPSLHLTALGRLAMIKVLPFWDWTSLFYESCLIANPFFGVPPFPEEDCMACESLERVDRLSDASYEHLLDNYLSRDAPAIVVDAMESWPAMTTDHFYFDNITQIYLDDDKLVDTVPCLLTSNLRTGSSDLHAFLKRIRNPAVEKWFVHWQNCDIHAVKALRRMYQRPYFLSSSVSPAHFNWVLMSSNYNTSVYKKVEPDSGLIMLAQIRGSTSFRLTPHKACNASCSQLAGNLYEGEMLIFTNFIWSFEYYPGRNMDNVAILTETVWGENTI